MSSDIATLEGVTREITGKKVKTLRDQGLIPVTVYHKGQESFNASVPYMPFVKLYNVVGQSQPVNLTVDGKEYLTMVKDVHIDPVRNEAVHVQFHSIDKNRAVEAEIPVHLEGDAPAVVAGNFLTRPNETVLVKAKASELPEIFNVSVEGLENPHDTVTVADVTIPEGVELLSDASLVLAIVEEPRVAEEPEETEVVDAADVPADNGGATDEAAEESK